MLTTTHTCWQRPGFQRRGQLICGKKVAVAVSASITRSGSAVTRARVMLLGQHIKHRGGRLSASTNHRLLSITQHDRPRDPLRHLPIPNGIHGA